MGKVMKLWEDDLTSTPTFYTTSIFSHGKLSERSLNDSIHNQLAALSPFPVAAANHQTALWQKNSFVQSSTADLVAKPQLDRNCWSTVPCCCLPTMETRRRKQVTQSTRWCLHATKGFDRTRGTAKSRNCPVGLSGGEVCRPGYLNDPSYTFTGSAVTSPPTPVQWVSQGKLVVFPRHRTVSRKTIQTEGKVRFQLRKGCFT